MRKYDFIVLEIIGEVSKDIMATAVASAIKKTYPNIPIIISTFHPEIWLHNTDVFRVYKTDTALYFYENYIVGKNTKIFKIILCFYYRVRFVSFARVAFPEGENLVKYR